MKLIAYVRCSTMAQAEDGAGLDIQQAEIQTWAKANGHRIVHVCEDVLSGTTPLQDRPGLLCVLDQLAERRAHGVVVWRLDRLARDLIESELILRELWAKGCEVLSVHEGDVRDDPTNPSAKMVRQILSAVAEHEKSMIVLRMRLGRQRKASHGGYAGYGSPAYGYRSVGGQLVPVEDEQAVRRRIVELRADGLSIRETIGVLDREGHRPKRGGVWHPTTISRIISAN